MQIRQKATKANKAIVNWSSFNIAADETVSVLQPNQESLLVNRVTGWCVTACHSAIDGRLTANGRIMLINANGILFGAGATVDVNAFVASSIDFTNEVLMSNGAITSRTSSNPNGFVINNGSITVTSGLAALVAPGVENNGFITAKTGHVALASGKRYTVDFTGDGLIQLALGTDMETSALVAGPHGTLQAAVANRGTIIADGGSVLLSARAAKAVMDNVIDMTGTVQARAVSSIGGRIVLHGGDENWVEVTGTLDASGGGGLIQVLGENVVLGKRVLLGGAAVGLENGAVLDVSGGGGLGRIRVGGDDAALPTDRSGTGGVKMAVQTIVSTATQLTGSGESDSVNVTGYVEYHEGTTPLTLTAVHGGTLRPTYVATRDCSGISDCSLSADLKTQELASSTADAVAQLAGGRPHLIMVNLHRSKVDANRFPDFADGTSGEGQKAHAATHALIDLSTGIVKANYGRGLLVDVHGTAHSRKAVELGYVVPGSVLDTYTDAELNASRYALTSSIAALGIDSQALAEPDFARVLRGDLSLGAIVTSKIDAYGDSYVSVPSPTDPGPGSTPYFSGGYLVQRHGSAGALGSASMDAIQMEATAHYRTHSDEARDQFARDFGASLVEFMNIHYGYGTVGM
jgi:filamentous hemagglutinin family protein